MKCFLLAGTSLLALTAAQPALAADAPLYKGSPPAVALFNWTGFYVGGNLGGVWGRSEVSDDPSAVIGLAGAGYTNSPAGVIGGLQIGYNWQAGNLVYGVEADIAAASASQSTDLFPPNGYFHNSSLSGLATLRGRIGIAMSPTLLYLTGGAALGWLKNEQVNPGVLNTTGRASTAWGWTIGGGIEHAFARNWSVKAEYLYTQFADATVADGNGYVFRFKDAYQTARLGINYRF